MTNLWCIKEGSSLYLKISSPLRTSYAEIHPTPKRHKIAKFRMQIFAEKNKVQFFKIKEKLQKIRRYYEVRTITFVIHHLAPSLPNHANSVLFCFPSRSSSSFAALSLSLSLREATGAFPIGYRDDLIIVVLRRSSSFCWIAMCSASSVYQRAFRETSFRISRGLVLPQTFHHG